MPLLTSEEYEALRLREDEARKVAAAAALAAPESKPCGFDAMCDALEAFPIGGHGVRRRVAKD